MSSPTDSRSDRRGGFYWYQEKEPFVSVTTVLRVLNKPALQYWFGKEVYRAMVINPTLTEKEALSAPYTSSKSAMGRGTTVHAIVENYVHEQDYVDQASEEFRPYAQAFYNWVKDHDIEILEHEKTLLSKKYGYAGTLDLLVKFRNSGRIMIIDVKTGKDIYEDYFLQLSAYKQALLEQDGIDAEMGILLLATGANGKPTGKSKFQDADYCFDEFLACKTLWEWKNAELIESVGYVKGVRKT
jgi:molybdopterin converting factor small subunit